MIKKVKKIVFVGLLPLCLLCFMGSCKTGEGCATNDKYGAEVDLSNTKRGKSSLFGKKRSKKIRKSGQSKG